MQPPHSYLCHRRIRFGDVLFIVQTDTDDLLRVGNRRSDAHVLGAEARAPASNHVARRRERLVTCGGGVDMGRPMPARAQAAALSHNSLTLLNELSH